MFNPMILTFIDGSPDTKHRVEHLQEFLRFIGEFEEKEIRYVDT